LEHGRHGIVPMPDWDRIEDLSPRLGGAIKEPLPKFDRKRTRTMGRVGQLALVATDQAIADAQLAAEVLQEYSTGLTYGSTHGSTSVTEEFCRKLLVNNSLVGIPGSSYLKFMSHTCAANLAQAYGIRGQVVPIVSACTSASQSIGAGYEAIKLGKQSVMLCGGAEELHVVHAAIFDLVYAASNKYNDQPDQSPRPFDSERDGLVVAEGAGTLVLEDMERAKQRGANIHAEIIGYGCCCDGTHVTSPSPEGMSRAMQLALQDAGVGADSIDYINGHATATEVGDIAESHAIAAVFQDRTPVSSTKGHTGHTLGACGAIEAGFCIWMFKKGLLPPTRNLSKVDERCAPLDYITGEPRAETCNIIMSNNFAFGGINTSLIFKRI
jgi:3-oxoacyl-[acyl-carrier-protein] synthase II